MLKWPRGRMAAQPSRCPSCGARVESMRLSFTETMLSCTGRDCIWPLDAEDDVDQFVTGVSQEGVSALGAVSAAQASKPPKQRTKSARHRKAKKQQLGARAAGAAPTDGRASPAASPIRSPEFAAAQDWVGISGDEGSCKPSDAGSMQPMLKRPRTHTAADSTDGALLLSSQPLYPAAAPGLEPWSVDTGTLQAQMDQLDAFLADDTL